MHLHQQQHLCLLENNQTLEDITHLQKIFTKNPNLFVSDFQGLIGEDGQFCCESLLGRSQQIKRLHLCFF
jgi:hypothetical protein